MLIGVIIEFKSGRQSKTHFKSSETTGDSSVLFHALEEFSADLQVVGIMGVLIEVVRGLHQLGTNEVMRPVDVHVSGEGLGQEAVLLVHHVEHLVMGHCGGNVTCDCLREAIQASY